MSTPEVREPAGQFEPRAVNAGRLLQIGLGLLAGILILIGAVTVWQGGRTGRWPDLEPSAGRLDGGLDVTPPTGPGQALQALRATEQAALHGYGWVDENAGLVRIPIERAMELLVQRGLPARAGGLPFQEPGPPLDSSSGQKMEEPPP